MGWVWFPIIATMGVKNSESFIFSRSDIRSVRKTRVTYTHTCGYSMSLKLDGIAKERICPGCSKAIHVDKLKVYKQVQRPAAPQQPKMPENKPVPS